MTRISTDSISNDSGLSDKRYPGKEKDDNDADKVDLSEGPYFVCVGSGGGTVRVADCIGVVDPCCQYQGECCSQMQL